LEEAGVSDELEVLLEEKLDVELMSWKPESRLWFGVLLNELLNFEKLADSSGFTSLCCILLALFWSVMVCK